MPPKLNRRRALMEKRFPESHKKAYYLMSIHEHLPQCKDKQI